MDSKMKFKNMQITLYLNLVCPVKPETVFNIRMFSE